jgi:ABC-2 type transport system ATP-binding protein
MQPEPIIQIANVTKIFRTKSVNPGAKPGFGRWGIFGRKVVDGLSLDIAPGEIFGFLGPNGAGKTTTIKLILGFIFPNSGEINLFGQPPGSRIAKSRIGFLPEIAYYYRYLKARELLDAYGKIFRIPKSDRTRKIESLLALVGLTDAAETPLRDFSKGMLQRFGLAQALINDPELLILDEPTSGLDPIARKEIRDIILDLHHQGKTIFFSSHELSQVELICTRVGILNQGKLVREGKLSDLLSPAGKIRIELTGIAPDLEAKVASFPIKLDIDHDQHFATIILDDKTRLCALLNLLDSIPGDLYAINTERETLEDLFVKTIKS